MKTGKPAFGWLLAACLVAATGAQTLFEDSFDTDENWVKASGTLQQSISGGTLVIDNQGTAPGALRCDNTYADFTYSVKLAPETATFASTGILFCWSTQFEGYMFTITNEKMYTLHRWKRSGTMSAAELVTLGWNSFISASSNTLTVSKKGNTINLFCNHVFLATVTDATFGSGSIGLYIGPGEKAAFDHALVTGDYQAATSQQYFFDDFEDAGLDGWRKFSGPGTVTVEGGVMKVDGGTTGGSTIMITNLDYRDDTARVILARTGGDVDGFAGLILMKIDVTMTTGGPVQGYNAYVFKTTAKGGDLDRYWAAHRLSTSEPIEYSLNQSSHIRGTTDTIEVTPDYDFLVNGSPLPNVDFGGGLDFNAVGVIVDSGVVVQFDNFWAGDSTGVAVAYHQQIRFTRPAGPRFILGGTGVVVDPLGRRVRTLSSRRQAGGPGARFTITGDDPESRLRRAIVNIE